MTWLLSLLVIVMALGGAPLFAVILAGAMLGFSSSDIDLAIIPIEVYRIVDTPLLVALPLFTFMGYILSESNTSTRLVNLIQSLFGFLPSGLALVGFLVCALFTALTGASGVTIVALGALLLPALQQGQFSERFSMGLVTTSGSLGLLLFPSVPLILYGVIAQQLDVGEPFSIIDLFVAGIVPLFLMLFLLIGYTLWVHRGGVIPKVPFSFSRVREAFYQARWELPLPLILFGGVALGIFAVSEAAAVSVVYVIFSQVFLYKDIAVKELPEIAVKSMMMVGGILLILGIALAFTNFLVDAEVPQRLFGFIRNYVESPITFLLMLNLFLLLLGAFLDIFAAIVIMVPILLPIAVGFGIHPVHLGIIFLANMQIGYFTPPVGMNLFIASYRFKKPLTELYASTLPFLVVMLFALIIITYLPVLSLWAVE
ncbi:TRAP transporter large permease subunit [Gammaproteobacteria bacterium]|nr:TRAP transporter large permease subunit [Gammaproteobacteria bacterium]